LAWISIIRSEKIVKIQYLANAAFCPDEEPIFAENATLRYRVFFVFNQRTLKPLRGQVISGGDVPIDKHWKDSRGIQQKEFCRKATSVALD
jgi:hypothetical protein